MKVVIIGSGNVATVLGRKIVEAQHELLQLVGRNQERAATLASALGCAVTCTLNDIDRHADLYLIAVQDQAIGEIAGQLEVGHAMVTHTAGSVSKQVLKKASTNFGVIYPLQSLRKELDTPPLPLYIDANSSDGIALVQDFSQTLSNKVRVAGDAERLNLHIGAVLVNNFTNHLYALAERYCTANGIDFSGLQPLIEETATRLRRMPAGQLQTGPAVRHDEATINLHLRQLSAFPEISDVYAFLSKSIQLPSAGS